MNEHALVIFGTGAYAKKVFHGATLAGIEVAGFVDENANACTSVPGVRLFHPEELYRGERQPGRIFIAIGSADVRRRLLDHHAALGWSLPSLVHPRATVAPDALIDPGVFVAAGAIVESGAHIGRGAIVDIGAIVDHDCQIGEFHHLRPGQICPAGTKLP
jgi:UDP-N-acetylbacillosamine N-acetyltransferase